MTHEEMMTHEEKVAAGLVAGDKHYKPPVNRWRSVKVKVPDGMRIGVTMDDRQTGELCLEIHPGEKWPEDAQLPEWFRSYPMTKDRPWFTITSEARGPAVGHEFLPNPDNPYQCMVCRIAYGSGGNPEVTLPSEAGAADT